MSGILHLTTFLQGGAGRAVVDLACAQHDAGHDVAVVASATACGEFGNYPHYIDRLHAHGVECWLVDSLFTRDCGVGHRVAAGLAQRYPVEHVDVVHAHAGTPARIALEFARGADGVRVVQTQHGWGSNKTAAQRAQDVATLMSVDRVVATSDATAGLLMGFGVPATQLDVVPCGLPMDTPDRSQEANRVASAYRARGLAVVGCVGSVTTNKNQAALVRALAHAPTAAAIVVGEGDHALTRLAVEERVCDRVHLAGYRADGDAWIGSFDVLVVPSRTEGQGVVVLEAFRAGVPVVASDIPPFRSLIAPGVTGWLCDPDDAVGMANAIRTVTELNAAHRQRVCRAARLKFEREFSLDAMIRGYDRVYATTSGVRRSGPDADALSPPAAFSPVG